MNETAEFTMPQLDEIRISKVGQWLTITQQVGLDEPQVLLIHELYVDRLIGALESAQNT